MPAKPSAAALRSASSGKFLALVPARRVRQPFVLRELPRGFLERALVVGEVEIHAAIMGTDGGRDGNRQRALASAPAGHSASRQYSAIATVSAAPTRQ